MTIFTIKSLSGNLTGLVTTFTYPAGVTYTSSVLSSGTINAAGTKWKVPGPLVEGVTQHTIRLTVEITDEDAFEGGTKQIKGVTTTYPGETETANNTQIKTIE